MSGRQRLEIDLRTARAQRRVDVVRVTRRRSDEHEVCRSALLEEFANVGRNTLVIGIVVRRLEIRTLILEHLEQLILQHLIHLADLVDKEDAAMCVRHQPRLRLGHAAVREALLCALIDRVVHRAEQRIRHVARIPAQGRPIRLYKGCILRERRHGAFFCRLEHKARRRGLAYARRPVEEEVLWIGRGQLCHE